MTKPLLGGDARCGVDIAGIGLVRDGEVLTADAMDYGRVPVQCVDLKRALLLSPTTKGMLWIVGRYVLTCIMSGRDSGGYQIVLIGGCQEFSSSTQETV